MVEPAPSKDGPASAEVNALHYVREIERFAATLVLAGEVARQETDHAEIVAFADDHEEDGRWFRTYRWYVVAGFDDGAGIARLTFAVPREEADSPEIDTLVGHFSLEAVKMRLTPDKAA